MKRLFIIRHAKSSWEDANLSDFDRPLNNRGEKDAPLMGNVLKRNGYKADLIISSPANRAITTARTVANQIDYTKEQIQTEASIYEASTQQLLEVVSNTKNSIDTLFIFGHNPSFTYFAEQLSNESIGNLPTCGVVGIQFDFDDWQLLSYNTGSCFYYDYPKNHK